MIENIEQLGPQLDSIPLPEFEVLEDGEIHVPEARVPEGVPAQISKRSKCLGNQDRISGNEAAAGSEGDGVGSHRRALGSEGAGEVNDSGTTSLAGGLRATDHRAAKPGAVWDTKITTLEIGGVS